MINAFKEKQIRDTGVINRGMFEQVKLLYSQDKEKAGELAISLMELVLTGEVSSDDFMVQFAVANHSIVVEKNKDKYDKKIEANRISRMENMELEKIAEALKKGVKQKDIATQLGVAKSTISKRIDIIKTDYPELLEDESFQSFQSFQYDNVNDNDNDNDNDTCFSPNGEKLGENPQTPATNSKEEFRARWGM